MLDLKFIRENPDVVRAMLAARRMTAPLEELIESDRKWRELLGEAESLRSHQNTVSKEIAQLKRDKQDASEQIAEMRTVSQKIKTLNEQSQSYKSEVDKILALIPNMPDSSTPIGNSEADNIEIRRWGDIRTFDFEPKPHWELAEALDIVDFQRRGKGRRQQLCVIQRVRGKTGARTDQLYARSACLSTRIYRGLAAFCRQPSNDDGHRTVAEI